MNWRQYNHFLIDLDGTIYRGKELIPYADTFIAQLKSEGKRYLYVTNNSTRRPAQIAEQLCEYGLESKPSEIFTSAQAAAALVKSENTNARALLIGEEGLHSAMLEEGLSIVDEKPTHVVVGLDRQFTYDKLKKAASAIRDGAKFIATNMDRVLITEKGLVPGSGSIVAAVIAASGSEPFVIGKPEKHIVELALARIGGDCNNSLMVGDNLYTDIAAGVKVGMDTLFVTTGVSTRLELEKCEFRPTYVMDSLEIW